MPTSSDCPDLHRLESFALGRLRGEQADAIEGHVADCPACAHTLGALPAIDAFVETMRLARPEDPCPELVAVLIRKLKRMGTEDTLQTLPPTGREAEGCAPFDFLSPARGPDELGWLGPYRVLETLGAGGMGVVFLGEDPRLKRQVALKVIKPDLVSSAEMRRRFLREAENVAAVEHENIVAIYEVNEQQGVPYLAMPLLRGESLESRLRQAEGPLPALEVVRVGRQVAEGLQAAHQRGLVHRDIKPANIWLESRGLDTPARVKILDFGLAQALSNEDPGASGQGGIAGTPAYMAPEQAAGRPTDGRSDLFSLGCVLYRMATGRPAFDGPDTFAVLAQIGLDEPPPPERLNPGLPAGLSRLIVRLLAKKPEERPASAREVVAALAQLEEKLTRRPRWPWLAVAGAVLAVGGVWAWLAAPSPPEPPPPGQVTLELDEPVKRLVLVHGDKERAIDLAANGRLELAAGDYQLRPADREEKRRFVPDRLVVEPGLGQTVPLRLVGEVRRSAEHAESVWAVALSPRAGELWALSASNDRTVGVWNAAGRQPPQSFDRHEAPVRAVAFAPDGRRAASAGGGRALRNDLSIRLWDVHTRQEVARLTGHPSWVVSLAFSADGDHLASGGADGMLCIWDLKKRERLLMLSGHDGEGVHGVAFTPDGKQLLTAGGDGAVVVWDLLAPERKPQPLARYTGMVYSIALASGGGLAVSAGADGTVRLWDLKAKKARVLHGHRGAVHQAVFAPDRRRVLSAGADGTVRLWDVASGVEVYRFEGHRGAVHGVACTADGRKAVSGGQDGTVRLWELPH